MLLPEFPEYVQWLGQGPTYKFDVGWALIHHDGQNPGRTRIIYAQWSEQQ